MQIGQGARKRTNGKIQKGQEDMAISDRKNQNLMNFIRKVHGVVENVDLEKHRQSQDHFGVLLSNSKDVEIREFEIEGIHGEWIAVNRAHMKKYIILYCHGGGYSTGSSVYARTLTTKFAMSTSMDVLCFDYRLAPENPYPAATEDAMKIWNYLISLLNTRRLTTHIRRPCRHLPRPTDRPC